MLDFGGQYTQLIARRIREQQVFRAVLPCTTFGGRDSEAGAGGNYFVGRAEFGLRQGRAEVRSGGAGAGDSGAGDLLRNAVDGEESGRESGAGGAAGIRAGAIVLEKAESHILGGLPEKLKIWESHGDNVLELPPGFHLTGKTANAIAAAEDPKRKIYAVQFHPEVNHTEHGTEILRNFLFRVCKAEPKWSGAAFIEETVEAIRQKVGTHHAICGLSGGSGLDGGGGAGASRDGRPADEYFREHRDAAEE